MVDQLIWFETLLKGGIGIIMMTFPVTASRIAGLPHGNTGFWLRLFGAALLGVACAFAIEGIDTITARGLGLGGAIVINLVAILMLVALLIFRRAGTRRGALLLWLLVLILFGLMLFEIGHAA